MEQFHFTFFSVYKASYVPASFLGAPGIVYIWVNILLLEESSGINEKQGCP